MFYGFIKFYSTFAALLIMMTASAVIAVIDDKRRHEADVITNSQIAHRLKADGMGGKGFVSEDVIWADVRVGDVLVVAGEERRNFRPTWCRLHHPVRVGAMCRQQISMAKQT